MRDCFDSGAFTHSSFRYCGFAPGPAFQGSPKPPSHRVSPYALCGRNVANANHHAANVLCPAIVLPVIREIQRSGASPHQIADALNARGISTAQALRGLE
jgi:hypothetical protein